jgi:hypothetical protein
MKHLLSLADDEMVLEASIVSEGQREIRGLMKLFSSSCLWDGVPFTRDIVGGPAHIDKCSYAVRPGRQSQDATERMKKTLAMVVSRLFLLPLTNNKARGPLSLNLAY